MKFVSRIYTDNHMSYKFSHRSGACFLHTELFDSPSDHHLHLEKGETITDTLSVTDAKRHKRCCLSLCEILWCKPEITTKASLYKYFPHTILSPNSVACNTVRRPIIYYCI